LFGLTRENLKHAYEGMAVSQANCDPLEHWYQLVQFISVSERRKLKGDALKADTLRAAAHMLRLLYKDLYGEDLAHPNEVTGQIITHFPELEVRSDTRRYLEFVVNRYGLNPRPKAVILVEGESEEIVIGKLFERRYGVHYGKHSIEIVNLHSVDNATGGKKGRFQAILRLIDYLHHHQTFAFLILDNENYAEKLKAAARKARSIHHGSRYVTRPEYIKIWHRSFEFDNFSCTEIAAAMNEVAKGHANFSRAEIINCKNNKNPGKALENLYRIKRLMISKSSN
jgi:hypothetical protein